MSAAAADSSPDPAQFTPTDRVVSDGTTPADRYADPSTPDPALITALLAPVRALRAMLGTGASVPDTALTTALSAAAAELAAAEAPHRTGVTALEATASGRTAQAAIPAVRRTASEVGDLAEHPTAIARVIADAHTTTSTAATRLDAIIAVARTDMRRILGTATARSDRTAAFDRASEALRDGLSAVSTARAELDGHSRALNALGPGTLTTSQAAAPIASTSLLDTNTSALGSGLGGRGTSAWVPSLNTTTTTPTTITAGMTPEQVAQIEMQSAALQAAVSLGSTALQAGVQVGVELIDKIAETAEHGIDTGAKLGQAAMDQAATHASGSGSGAASGSTPASGSGSSSPALFDFGGGSGSGSGTDSHHTDPPASTGPTPGTAQPQQHSPGQATTPPPSSSGTGTDSGPASSSAPGSILPPPANPTPTSPPRHKGQLGVTVPTSAPAEKHSADPSTEHAAPTDSVLPVAGVLEAER